jgi:hypothetical protein
MKVTIYYKSSEAETPSVTYDLDYNEFTRLASDFEKYLKEGTPKLGIYRYHIDSGMGRMKNTKELILDFQKVSVIG